MDVARHKNSVPLPLIKPFTGPKLPPDRYCLMAPNYRLKSQKKVDGVWIIVFVTDLLLLPVELCCLLLTLYYTTLFQQLQYSRITWKNWYQIMKPSRVLLQQQMIEMAVVVVIHWNTCQRASKDIFASAMDFDCWKRELAKRYIHGMKEQRSRSKMMLKRSRFHGQSLWLCKWSHWLMPSPVAVWPNTFIESPWSPRRGCIRWPPWLW